MQYFCWNKAESLQFNYILAVLFWINCGVSVKSFNSGRNLLLFCFLSLHTENLWFWILVKQNNQFGSWLNSRTATTFSFYVINYQLIIFTVNRFIIVYKMLPNKKNNNNFLKSQVMSENCIFSEAYSLQPKNLSHYQKWQKAANLYI